VTDTQNGRYSLWDALLVNDVGQIVAKGWDNQDNQWVYVLLTPASSAPEPTGGAVLVTLSTIALLRRRPLN
jgi:hypothetical protein